ncbi:MULTISPECIES: hypothetical protein [unclassified Leclercia]|uniref:Uncharacterized protein n=1 Tax=Leclercia barmai TaxID=2785629 RepID=A0ABS7RYA4_9ENTR|nr:MULTISPECIES: hypothetical protein [unclassified Leclercia]MBZ0059279.1 hypothetical protein [Leclercia sp. EMC7]MCM5697464.1 hypothetical protein [Leclercia sp. LTM01]MCM5701911.1 hypothetical protein [Leclercia sp. LTM14]
MLGLSSEAAALLGASAAIGIPLVFNLIKEVCFDRRKRNAERAYISVQLVFLLDKFAGDCEEVSWDRGFDESGPEPDSPEYLEIQVDPPVFDMSTVKGEYKYLEPSLIYRLQSIDVELLKVKQRLREMTSNPNFGAEIMDKYILLRRELYADVGLTVVQLSADIRAKLKIDVDHGWSSKDSLLRSKAHIWRIKSRGALRRMERKAQIKMRLPF